MARRAPNTIACAVALAVTVRAEIYDDEWADTKRRYGMSDEGWRLDLVSTELERICAKYGIGFFNPTEAFRSEAASRAAPEERLYFIADGHWTTLGHDLVGRLLGEG